MILDIVDDDFTVKTTSGDLADLSVSFSVRQQFSNSILMCSLVDIGRDLTLQILLFELS